MNNWDSRHIEQIKDNTEKMADAFARIADALERLEARKSEPQTCSTCKFDHKEWYEPECDSCCDSNSNWQPKDEPQSGYCNECKWFEDKQVCGRCRSKNLYTPKPQTDCGWK